MFGIPEIPSTFLRTILTLPCLNPTLVRNSVTAKVRCREGALFIYIENNKISMHNVPRNFRWTTKTTLDVDYGL